MQLRQKMDGKQQNLVLRRNISDSQFNSNIAFDSTEIRVNN